MKKLWRTRRMLAPNPPRTFAEVFGEKAVRVTPAKKGRKLGKIEKPLRQAVQGTQVFGGLTKKGVLTPAQRIDARVGRRLEFGALKLDRAAVTGLGTSKRPDLRVDLARTGAKGLRELGAVKGLRKKHARAAQLPRQLPFDLPTASSSTMARSLMERAVERIARVRKKMRER